MIATAPWRRGRRQHDLDALTARERGGQERGFLIDPLPGGVRDELREPPAPVEVRKRAGSRCQPARVSMKASPGRVDAELRDLGIGEQGPQRPQRQLEGGGLDATGSQRRPRSRLALARHGEHPALVRLGVAVHRPTGNPHRARPAPGCDRRSHVTVGGMLIVLLRTSVMTSCGARGVVDHRAAVVRATARPPARRHRSRRSESPRRSAARSADSTLPGSPERPSSSVPGEASGTTTPVGVRASVQSTKTPRLPCCTCPRVSPDELRAALEQHDRAIGTEGIGRRDAGRHARAASSRSPSRACNR